MSNRTQALSTAGISTLQPAYDPFAPASIEQALMFAKHAAASSLVPQTYRGKPGDILIAMQMGNELGLKPMQSLQSIAVINGKPSIYGDALLAICRAHPDFVDIVETYDAATSTATCTVTRRDSHPVVAEFSRKHAERAKLWGKAGPWQSYPERMLQMRARGFALRDAFADALSGMIAAEEAGDIPAPASAGPVTIDAEATQPAVDASPFVDDAPPAQPQEPAQSEQPADDGRPTSGYVRVMACIANARSETELQSCLDDAKKLANGERKHAQDAYRAARERLANRMREPGED